MTIAVDLGRKATNKQTKERTVTFSPMSIPILSHFKFTSFSLMAIPILLTFMGHQEIKVSLSHKAIPI